MDKSEYSIIRELAWDILIDIKANTLPIKITPISILYKCKNSLNYSDTRYNNTLIISIHILKLFRIQTTQTNIRALTNRLLCPMCVLKECNIDSPHIISQICDVPLNIALERYNRLQMLIKRGKFYTSDLEKKVYQQFLNFIINYNKS